MLFERILIGLLLIGAGIVMLKYTFQIVGFTGKPDWIEYRLGSGPTYTVYKILGILLAIWGAMYMTGTSRYVTDAIGEALRGIFRLPSSGS
jgi:hypothetical protein